MTLAKKEAGPSGTASPDNYELYFLIVKVILTVDKVQRQYKGHPCIRPQKKGHNLTVYPPVPTGRSLPRGRDSPGEGAH